MCIYMNMYMNMYLNMYMNMYMNMYVNMYMNMSDISIMFDEPLTNWDPPKRKLAFM